MKQRRRIYYSAAQRSEIWDRWQAGEPMSSIGRRFDRESSSVFSVISPTGGIRPPARRRAREALSLFEREEISRGLSAQSSLRLIACQLRRSASTISCDPFSDIGLLHPRCYMAPANTSCSLRGFSDAPHGAFPNVMRYGDNASSIVRAACRSAVVKPSVNRS